MAMGSNVRIRVRAGGAAYEFSSDQQVTIGRDPTCSIVLTNPEVSRQHAVLSFDGSTWVLENRGQRGTYVQGSSVTRVPITGATEAWLADPTTGDRIELVPLGVKGVAPTVVPAAPGGAMAAGGTPPTAVPAPGGAMGRSSGIRVRLGGAEHRFQPGQEVLIGRLPTADVQTDDPSVSREHARLRSEQGVWTLESMGQRGTYLNGTPVTRLPIGGPMTLRLGDPTTGQELELTPDTAAMPTAMAGAPAAGATQMPGGGIAPGRVTGQTSVIRRLATANRRTQIIAAVAAALAIVLAVVAITMSLGGGGGDSDVQSAIKGAAPKTAIIKITLPNGSGNGSGWVYDANEGFLVTNSHVAEEPGAKLEAGILGNYRQATVIGLAPCDDLAVVQIDPNGLEAFTLGSSADLQAGQTVVSLGYGSQFKSDKDLLPTSGRIVLPSTDFKEQGYPYLIQHEATIQPGNSGGPLVNLDGELVGVNTLYNFLSSDGRPVQNQYYAIPSDRVKQVVPTLAKGISMGFDGVGPRSLTLKAAKPLGIPGQILIVTAVDPSGSAGAIIPKPQVLGVTQGISVAKAWAITKIDGAPLDTIGAYCDAIREKQEGDTAVYNLLPVLLASQDDPTQSGAQFDLDRSVVLKKDGPGKAITINF